MSKCAQFPRFIIYDERALVGDPMDAVVLSCEETREKAIEALESLGYGGVIHDTQTNEMEHYVPKAMRDT